MSKIVEKMQRDIINRSSKFEEQTRGTKDDIFNMYINMFVLFQRIKM